MFNAIVCKPNIMKVKNFKKYVETRYDSIRKIVNYEHLVPMKEI